MKKINLLFFAFLIAHSCFATHVLGGEITYTRVSGLEYKFRVFLYTHVISSVETTSINLNMGIGGSPLTVNRTQRISISNEYDQNVYEVNYTYPGQGNYVVSLKELSRGNFTNAPKSPYPDFYVQTTISINPFLGDISFSNLAPLILFAQVGTTFQTNLTNYSNLSTDSLSYVLHPCLQASNVPLSDYQYPVGLTLNSISGELVWNNPTQVGTFGVAARISLWRNGTLISTMLRDFMIVVKDGMQGVALPELAPQASIDLSNPNGTQIAVGQKVTFRMIVNKNTPNPTELAFFHPTLTANLYDSLQYRVAKFEWTPTEINRQKQPYILTFRAKSNYTLDKTILLYVGYPPQTPRFITSLEQPEIDNNFVRIFPNPTKDFLNLSFDIVLTDAELHIYNETGKELLKYPIKQDKNIQLSLSNLPEGIYFYKVISQKRFLHRGKFIKH